MIILDENQAEAPLEKYLFTEGLWWFPWATPEISEEKRKGEDKI